MKKFFKLLLCFALLLLVTSCAAVTSPLRKAETTPVPGLPMELHAASAPEDRANRQEITLFFRYQQTGLLAAETRSIMVPLDESLELTTVRQLLAGPQASHTELTRLFPHGTAVVDVTPSGDTLQITLTENLENDGIPADWKEDPAWREEAPLRRRLAIQSLVATMTENFHYPYVQIFIARDQATGISTRLNSSYFLDGRTGPEERLSRDESLLLNMHNTADVLLRAWQERDYPLLYQFTADLPDIPRPAYDDFAEQLSGCVSVVSYEAGAGHNAPGRSQATVTLALECKADGQTLQYPAYPLRLVRNGGIWKVSFADLKRLMLQQE